MIRQRSSFDAADAIVWVSSCILAALIGIGVSSALWARLHRGGPAAIIDASLAALVVGTLLVGLALQRPLPRAFVMILGVSVALGYALGSSGFSRLIGP